MPTLGLVALQSSFTIANSSIPFPQSHHNKLQHAPKTLRPTTRIKAKQLDQSQSSLGQNFSPAELVKTVGKYVWGKGLPPELLISTVRVSWATLWKTMMTQMAPSDPTGSFSRVQSQFRSRPTDKEAGRYHLYAAWACPWAHRTLIVRALKGLDSAVGASILAPSPNGYWEFPSPEDGDGLKKLIQVYKLRQGGYDGRASVPMLWDAKNKDVVNNESSDIIEIFNSDLNGVAEYPDLDLAPEFLREDMQKWNDLIYTNVNNGVYRPVTGSFLWCFSLTSVLEVICGFAQTQYAYEAAANALFDTLDKIEDHLSSSRYLCGEYFTLADIRLFTTLIRFDIVYHGLFKCSKKKLSEYPNLYGYVMDIYQIPRIAATCNLEAIMDGYYCILFPLNPGGIKPLIPQSFQSETLNRAHKRELISRCANL